MSLKKNKQQRTKFDIESVIETKRAIDPQLKTGVGSRPYISEISQHKHFFLTVKTTSLNIREEPDPTSKILGSVSNETKLEMNSTEKFGNFFCVKYLNGLAFVNSDYVELDPVFKNSINDSEFQPKEEELINDSFINEEPIKAEDSEESIEEN